MGGVGALGAAPSCYKDGLMQFISSAISDINPNGDTADTRGIDIIDIKSTSVYLGQVRVDVVIAVMILTSRNTRVSQATRGHTLLLM